MAANDLYHATALSRKHHLDFVAENHELLASVAQTENAGASSGEDEQTPQATSRKNLKGEYVCQFCGTQYADNRSLRRHLQTSACRNPSQPEAPTFGCTQCSRSFSRRDTLKRHESEVHMGKRRVQERSSAAKRVKKEDTRLPLVQSHASALQDYAFHGLRPLVLDGQFQEPYDLIHFSIGLQPGLGSTNNGSTVCLEDTPFPEALDWISEYPYSCEHDQGEHLPRAPHSQTTYAPYTTRHSSHTNDVGTLPYLASEEPSVLHRSVRSQSFRYEHSRSLEKTQIERYPRTFSSENLGVESYEMTDERVDEDLKGDSTNEDVVTDGTMETHASFQRVRGDRFRDDISSLTTHMKQLRLKSGNSKNRCVFCKEPYEENEAELMAHLHRHLEDAKKEHLCDKCDLAFVNKADLEYHLASASLGRCGFDFQHHTLCTGHHPPTIPGVDVACSKLEHVGLVSSLGAWSAVQIHAHQRSVARLADLRRLLSRRSYSSLLNACRQRRESVISLVCSLLSLRSTPNDVDYSYDSRTCGSEGSVYNRRPFYTRYIDLETLRSLQPRQVARSTMTPPDGARLRKRSPRNDDWMHNKKESKRKLKAFEMWSTSTQHEHPNVDGC